MGELTDTYFLLAHIHAQKIKGQLIPPWWGMAKETEELAQPTATINFVNFIQLIFTKLILPTGNTDGFETTARLCH